MESKILITGANGQLGLALTEGLCEKYGNENLIITDLEHSQNNFGIFEKLDVLDKVRVDEIFSKYKINEVYHLAAILSAKGEENPLKTWQVNLQTWLNILEACRIYKVKKVFFPSSIAVFGSKAPKNETPNDAYLNPTTIYGMSKATAENWGQYYYHKYDLDVRSIRFPGIIGYQSLAHGGTTDYAVEIFHKAILHQKFTCYLNKNTQLPMLFMNDAVRAIIELMEAKAGNIKIRTSYNLSGLSFSPEELMASIKTHYPNFKIEYHPDHRQQIADNWPDSINDAEARNDWNWQPNYNLEALTAEMIQKLQNTISK